MADLDATRTPPEYFAQLDSSYHFVFDLFASTENHLVGSGCWFSAESSALAIGRQWPRLNGPEGNEGWCFMNPPYSRGNVYAAVNKAIEQAKLGSGIVGLIPATTGVQWFNDLILRRCDVLDGYTVDNPVFSGYCLSMSGAGYRQKVTFLRGRVPFLPPLDWPADEKWSPPTTDSILLELQPPLR